MDETSGGENVFCFSEAGPSAAEWALNKQDNLFGMYTRNGFR